jgi:Cytochrome c-type biogenesis protein CcmE
MTPPNQRHRIKLVAFFAILLAGGVFFLLSALKENSQFFYNPSDVVADDFISDSAQFKIGGLVMDGSVTQQGELTTLFKIKDFEREMDVPISVAYTGVLPDLFREGQGVVITGELTDRFHFTATEVLAKHDENYQPDIKYKSDK